jgi:protein SCO1/2
MRAAAPPPVPAAHGARYARALVPVLLAVLLLAACHAGPSKFKSTDITGADYGKSLALSDPGGRTRTLKEFLGKVVVVFFGYTQCPDVCPTTLAELARVMKALGSDANRVQVLFVTLDPERDTPAVLARYVGAFDPRFLGLRGDAEQTREVAKEFKIFYRKRPGAEGAYSLDHSAQAYVIDPQGRLRLFVRYRRLAADLPDDIRALLEGG